MPKRRNIICQMRRPLTNKRLSESAPNGLVWRDRESDRISVAWYERRNMVAQHLSGLTTADARLLAKRINQFLDGKG